MKNGKRHAGAHFDLNSAAGLKYTGLECSMHCEESGRRDTVAKLHRKENVNTECRGTMLYRPPATFQGSQIASHWHYQVHCPASALRRYSHCLSPSRNGCNLGKHSQAAVWDSPKKEALQGGGFKTHTPGKAEVWAQEMTPPTEDEHHAAQPAAPMTENLCLPSRHQDDPAENAWTKILSSDLLVHLIYWLCAALEEDSKLIRQVSFAICQENFCHNRQGTFSLLQPEDKNTILR